jgi:type II secretory pathway pseudopilin PulG
VIVVIGVLSAFILVGMSSITSKANIAKSQAFLNSMNNALLLGRVSQWKLDETSNVVVSDSWGINTGGWYGPGGLYTQPSWRTSSECISGGCLAFDGTDDYVNCGSNASLNITNEITISAWAYPLSSGGFIVRKTDPGYLLGTAGPSNNVWFTWIRGDDNLEHNFISLANIKYNTWTYLTMTFKKYSFYKLYVNGIFDNQISPVTYGIKDNLSSGLLLGYYDFFTGAEEYQGLIDDVRIYNNAIPISRIEQNYYVGINKLFKNNGITSIEYNQRIAELKNHSAKQ